MYLVVTKRYIATPSLHNTSTAVQEFKTREDVEAWLRKNSSNSDYSIRVFEVKEMKYEVEVSLIAKEDDFNVDTTLHTPLRTTR